MFLLKCCQRYGRSTMVEFRHSGAPIEFIRKEYYAHHLWNEWKTASDMPGLPGYCARLRERDTGPALARRFVSSHEKHRHLDLPPTDLFGSGLWLYQSGAGSVQRGSTDSYGHSLLLWR